MPIDDELTPAKKAEALAQASVEEPAADIEAASARPEAAVATEEKPSDVAEAIADMPEPEEIPSAPEPEAPTDSAQTAQAEDDGMPVAVPQAAPEPVEIGQAESTDAELFDAAMQAMDSEEGATGTESGFKKLIKGDRVEATVIQVDSDRVFVDLGTKSEGIVPIGELTDSPIEHASEHVKVGDKIEVVVLRPEGAEGNAVVSKKRADFENTWLSIEEAFNAQKSITAPVIDRVKGGLVVDIGVRGFVPATHVGNGKLRNIDKYVGQTLECRILEIDRERKKVVLSNRIAEEEKRVHAKENLFNTVKPGDVLEGVVRRLTDYGAFVDLGGVDGLLHISEMSWMRISHPREMFKEGQKIQIMVLRLDKESGKISLGHRQVLPDPWNLIRENYRGGQKLNIKISRLVQSGAFVKLPEGAEAFLPLSEMSARRLKRPQEAVEEGQEVDVQIIDLKPDERRMVLSIRAIGGGMSSGFVPSAPTTGPFDDDREGKRAGGKKKKKGRSRQEEEEMDEYIGRRSFGGGGVTIGERLGMLKGFAGKEDAEEADLDAVHEVEAAPATEAPEEVEAAPATELPAEDSGTISKDE